MWNGFWSIEGPKENWGCSQKIWEAALQRVMLAIPNHQPNAESALLLEYGRLYWPTMDVPQVGQHYLEELANEIVARASSATSETNWLRLSSILSHFAVAC